MKKQILKKYLNVDYFYVLLYFIVATIIFTWVGKDKIIMAGDFSWPISFKRFIEYTLYYWDDSVNLGYSASRQLSSFYPYAVWGFVLESIGFSGPLIQKIIFYIAFSFSGIGMYFLSIFFELEKKIAFLVGILYMFSPYALAVAWVPSYGISFPFYCFFPISIYFFIVFIVSKNLKVQLKSLLGIGLLFFGASYSNPVFLMLFIGTAFYFFAIIIYSKKYSKKFLLKNVTIFFILYLLINAFWAIPFVFDLKGQYTAADNAIAGLINDTDTVKLNSVYVSEAFRMTGLWALKGEFFGEYYYDWNYLYKSNIHIILEFLLVLFTVYPLLIIKKIKNGKYRNIIYGLIILFLIGILLNSGMKNDGLLNIIAGLFFKNNYLLRAFRSVYLKLGLLLVFPSVLLVGIFFSYFLRSKYEHTKNWIITFFLLIFFATIASPFLSGNIIKKNAGEFIMAYDVKIPDTYRKLSINNRNNKLLNRIISIPIPSSYNLFLKWEDGGYQGADFLRFLMNKPLIYQNNGLDILKNIANALDKDKKDDIDILYSLMSVKHFFQHRDISRNSQRSFLNKNIEPYIANNYGYNEYFVFGITDNKFLPHFYTPVRGVVSDRGVDELVDIVSMDDWEIRSAVFFEGQNEGKEEVLKRIKEKNLVKKDETGEGNQVLEFKKINPTKYRVRVHNAKGEFPLVFSESFHDGWRAYVRTESYQVKSEKLSSYKVKSALNTYKILDGNDDDQATKKEVAEFIEKGLVTDLGDGKEKEIKHQKWSSEKQKEELDYIEKYNIDFISKNFQGTIQNDNLAKGKFYETWLAKKVKSEKLSSYKVGNEKLSSIFKNNKVIELPEENHLMANGYANSWLIDTDAICGVENEELSSYKVESYKVGNEKSFCTKNSDGTYDLELVIEFWPQRLFYIGLFISGTTLILCLIYLGYDWNQSRKSKTKTKTKPQN